MSCLSTIEKRAPCRGGDGRKHGEDGPTRSSGTASPTAPATPSTHENSDDGLDAHAQANGVLRRAKEILFTFGKFVGPGFVISVAYIDPGNYATDISAGASYRFRLLFIVLLSNLVAVLLQILSVRLGTISGLNLAQACRAFLPRWLNICLYILIEAAIVATDIAEVIGAAIAINLLIPQIPLVAGCAISIFDVMIILLFYRPNGSMKGLRAFELFVTSLVMAVVICFCIQLSLIKNTSVGDVFMGFLPSSSLIQKQGLYQACGILGATVMPHSLYLGSGMVQPRLLEYDAKEGLLPGGQKPDTDSNDKMTYIPSLSAIRYSLKYSIAELAIPLCTFALFINSAILIVAGASLYNQNPLDADIFGIHALLSSSLSPAAGTVFALSLLFSGVSSGIVCTMAGQMVSEGALNWSMRPWLRRLITRSLSITPSIIIAGAVGREGLDATLNGSQVVLSIVLPFVSAPLVYFTCLDKYMTVRRGNARFLKPGVPGDDEGEGEDRPGADDVVRMSNSWWVAVLSVIVWLLIVIMNVANLVFLGIGS